LLTYILSQLLLPLVGEDISFLGDEERKIIIPAIEKAKKKDIRCDVPVSADTIFYKALKGYA
jgi:4-hydroxythreonine-4-phosphate dehydrogenase